MILKKMLITWMLLLDCGNIFQKRLIEKSSYQIRTFKERNNWRKTMIQKSIKEGESAVKMSDLEMDIRKVEFNALLMRKMAEL
jgi:hypothetical protein